MPVPNPEPSPTRNLAHGLVLRGATAGDVDGLVALYETAFGEQDGPDVRAFLTDPQILEAWSVVCDGSTIASAIGRIDHRMQIDGLEFVTAQIEYVATDDELSTPRASSPPRWPGTTTPVSPPASTCR